MSILKVRRFQAGDEESIEPSDRFWQENGKGFDWRAGTLRVTLDGPSWTGVVGDRIVIIAGLSVMKHPGRVRAWCVLARDIPREVWISIHREVQRRFAQAHASGVRRIEADCVASFAQGNRWMRMLGMRFERRMPKYGPQGDDYNEFVSIKEI